MKIYILLFQLIPAVMRRERRPVQPAFHSRPAMPPSLRATRHGAFWMV